MVAATETMEERRSGARHVTPEVPPLPLLTKEGSENRQKSPTRFGEEPFKKESLNLGNN